MAPQFPLIQPPNCPLCPNTPIRARVDPAKRSPTAGRPYYYCQADHKRQFLTWDDMLGISSANPRCRCGHHSRRNEGNGPVPSAWYNCSSRRCSFNQNIDVDDIDESPHSSPSSRQGSTGSSTIAGSTYGGNDRKMTAREENDSELLDKMNAMTVKIKKLETTIASRPSTTARPIDGDCCVHGNGRRSFFSRRRCICI
ncbi:hypothetical protein BFJ70_g4353 [Fusarium oxysporum]|nr:uncharacterized protein FOBCDRAFT_244047 [Fusarium oxysporum Fo47]EGU75891.1 hypothetical protein FOXB_13594 [Fusarium oxysporum f. sp. conglutinans Fo5176]ENH64155.1 hypothetical protein FOC1_g10004431 [Fusarium oxysporum f. sp. cubense race 1]KAG7001250.1 hypothetical protein FocnCong_v012152 [Fusarium oxysporum f. sp. conglutinans]KAI8405899.1 hypothetical protein FOFC_13360 [Fusarium oxysporum]QKD60304.1 hypothetical protein FOBCDRAFT_244047 [Fusarium oxysporum Fo47]